MTIILVPIEVSARHIHLSIEDKEALFGKDYNLTPKKYLSQSGEFLCEEKVSIINKINNKFIENISILGPERKNTQVELSTTDCIKLGMDKNKMYRISGDIKDTPGIIIKYKNTEIEILKGVIIPLRHLHIDDNTVDLYAMQNSVYASAFIDGIRGCILNNIIIRQSSKAKLAIHIDTDEANCLGLNGGEIVKCQI